jgi:hypothetical protein
MLAASRAALASILALAACSTRPPAAPQPTRDVSTGTSTGRRRISTALTR